MEHLFICPRCHNSDPKYIGYKNGIPYCRACISFQGKLAETSYQIQGDPVLHLDYPLSKAQEEISTQVLEHVKSGKNVLIHAVTGAGKTELVYQSMEYILKKGGHVGFATPRKDVVIDLVPRVQEAFSKLSVIAVYGEHNSKLEADIILLTCHQLYRYPSYFDLLIMDEIDAFPYRGNEVLHAFFQNSIRGSYVLLSATPSEKDIKEIKADHGDVLELFERYHHHKLPEPVLLEKKRFSMIVTVIKKLLQYQKENKPTFVFVPTIELGEKLFSILNLFVSHGSFVSSKEERRRIDIEKFKANEFHYLVTTSILERGVTVKNLQVIVTDADHPLYDASGLIQIAGRAGRKIDAPEGEVIFIGKEKTDEIQRAITEIHRYNEKAGLL